MSRIGKGALVAGTRRTDSWPGLLVWDGLSVVDVVSGNGRDGRGRDRPNGLTGDWANSPAPEDTGRLVQGREFFRNIEKAEILKFDNPWL